MSKLVLDNIIEKIKNLSSAYSKASNNNQFRMKQMYLSIKTQEGLRELFESYRDRLPKEMKLNCDISHQAKYMGFSIENKGIKYQFNVENEKENESFLNIAQEMMEETGSTPAEKQSIKEIIGNLRFIVKNSENLEREYELGRIKPMHFLKINSISKAVRSYKDEDRDILEIKESMSRFRSDMVKILQETLPEPFALKENLDLEMNGIPINRVGKYGASYSIYPTDDAKHFGLNVSSPEGLRTMAAYRIGLDSYNAISDAFKALKDIDVPLESELENQLNIGSELGI